MRRLAATWIAVLAVLAVAAGPAAATTFCVPDFHAGCPDNGTNVKETDLETALSADGSDGQDDRVVIGSHIYADVDTIEATGTDGLEVVGSGPADTVLTSIATTNIYVFDMSGRGAPQTVRDLRIVVPASFPNGPGYGSAAQVRKATVENVDVESRNAGSSGIYFIGGGTFRDGAVYGTSAGVFSTAITVNGASSGPLTVERATIEDAQTALSTNQPGVPITARRVSIAGAALGVHATGGGDAEITDSLVTTTGTALSATTSTADASAVTARNVTLVGLPGTTALYAQVSGALTGGATITLSDSIARGFPQTWYRSAPVNLLAGNANVLIDHSNLTPAGISTGDGSVTLGAGNLDADPLFAGPSDFRLSAGSPSIDAGDPAVSLAPGALDLAGLPRTFNSTGAAQAIRDQGAYEFQSASAPPGGGAPAPGAPGGGEAPGGGAPAGGGTPAAADRTRPRITGLKLRKRLTRSRGGEVRLTLGEPAKVTLTFTRKVKGAKARVVRIGYRGRSGPNRLRVGARRLKAARWTLSAVAVDAAGNRSAVARRQVSVGR